MLKKTITITITLLMLVSSSFAASVKWYPGHYLRSHWYHETSISENFLDQEYTKGIYIGIRWKDLEPTEGNYDFTLVDKFLNIAKSRNKYFMLYFLDRCFSGSCTDAYAPAYLRTNPIYNGGVEPFKHGGSVVRIWDPVVNDRIIALFDELGQMYDNDPNFAGIVPFGESAIAIDKRNTPGYTHANYIREIKRQMYALSQSFSHTPSLMGANFIGNGESTLRELATYLETLGNSGMNHPDTVPEKPDLAALFKIEEEFKNRIAMSPNVQTMGLPIEVTEEDVYNFMMNTLGANFIIWNNHFYNKWEETKPNYVNAYVLPVIREHRGATNTVCPSSYDRCVTNGQIATNTSNTNQANTNVLNHPVYKTEIEHIIDGNLEEFSRVKPIQIMGSNGAVGNYKILYDDNNLYIGAQVRDTRLNSTIQTHDGPLWQDDSVEIIFDTLNQKGTEIDDDNYKFIVNLNNAHLDALTRNKRWEHSFESSVTLDGTLNNNNDEDTGYTIEIKIPWWNDVAPRTRWGINIQLDDSDGTQNYYDQLADTEQSFNVPTYWHDILFLSENIGNSNYTNTNNKNVTSICRPETGYIDQTETEFIIDDNDTQYISVTDINPNENNVPFFQDITEYTLANLFVCEDYDFVLGRCELTPQNLTDQPAYQGVPFEAEFSVDYTFNCSGHRPNIGVKSGSSYKAFQIGERNGRLDGIVGSESLTTYDPDPATTSHLSFQPGCFLHIEDIGITPSFWAIEQWHNEADAQVKILDYAINYYTLLLDFNEINQWDLSKLSLIEDRMIQLVEAYPDNINYRMILASVSAAIQNRPNPYTDDEVENALSEVIIAAETDLRMEYEKALFIQERFSHFDQGLSEELEDTMEHYPL